MPDINDSFEVQEGLSVEGKVLYSYTSVDPSVVGVAAPIGSILMSTVDGAPWRKIGAADTDWTLHGVSQFGLELLFEKSAAQSATSLTTFQTKVQLTTPNLSLGDYRIGWNALVGNTDNNKESEYRLRLNDTDIESMQIQSVKLEYDQIFSGFTFQTLSGVNNIYLEYRAITGSSRIEEASIEFWQVL